MKRKLIWFTLLFFKDIRFMLPNFMVVVVLIPQLN